MAQFHAMVRATLKRNQDEDERAWEKLAWQTALLMNATGNMKEPVKADDLLGRASKTTDYEALKARLAKHKAEQERKAHS